VFLLERILAHIDFLDESIEKLEAEIGQHLVPFQQEVNLLESLPVILQVGAAVVIAEIGTDMSRFPSAKHLASWAGVCPGNNVSAGKRLSGKTRKGNRYLRSVLCQLAWAIARCKEPNYLTAQYHQIAWRRGKKRAILAVAHSLLVIIYHLLREKKPYTDLGADFFDKRDDGRIQHQAIARLEQLGFQVSLTKKEEVA
jgi:transposase